MESKHPDWHTGSSLWSSFRFGRQQQDAICSDALKGSGLIRRGRGRTSWNNNLQSKSQCMARTGCMDLKPSWSIYKFCFYWWQAGCQTGDGLGSCQGQQSVLRSHPPTPPPLLWERARLVGTSSSGKQSLIINFTHVRVKAQAFPSADTVQGI